MHVCIYVEYIHLHLTSITTNMRLMRPRQKSCGDKMRRWKGGHDVHSNWIPSFHMSWVKWKTEKNFPGDLSVFFFSNSGFKKISPPTRVSWHWEGQKQNDRKRCRRGVFETSTMRICPWFFRLFQLFPFFLQKHWIYSDEFFFALWLV